MLLLLAIWCFPCFGEAGECGFQVLFGFLWCAFFAFRFGVFRQEIVKFWSASCDFYAGTRRDGELGECRARVLSLLLVCPCG
jgi:hypothetical protein